MGRKMDKERIKEMEKKKINLDVTFEQETRTFTDKNGNDVVILKWIPAEEKEAFARELVE